MSKVKWLLMPICSCFESFECSEAFEAFERCSLFLGYGLRQILYPHVIAAEFLPALMLSTKHYTKADENIAEHKKDSLAGAT